MTQLYDDALEPCGLRSTQYAIVNELARRGNDPPTMRELADALVMDRSSLGHNVRPLERDGLLTIEEAADDRRRKHLVLTRAGTAKYRSAKRLWERAQAHFERIVGAKEAAALRAALLAIAADERLARIGA